MKTDVNFKDSWILKKYSLEMSLWKTIENIVVTKNIFRDIFCFSWLTHFIKEDHHECKLYQSCLFIVVTNTLRVQILMVIFSQGTSPWYPQYITKCAFCRHGMWTHGILFNLWLNPIFFYNKYFNVCYSFLNSFINLYLPIRKQFTLKIIYKVL